jgi:hypothetical protein
MGLAAFNRLRREKAAQGEQENDGAKADENTEQAVKTAKPKKKQAKADE